MKNFFLIVVGLVVIGLFFQGCPKCQCDTKESNCAYTKKPQAPQQNCFWMTPPGFCGGCPNKPFKYGTYKKCVPKAGSLGDCDPEDCTGCKKCDEVEFIGGEECRLCTDKECCLGTSCAYGEG